MTRKNSGSRRKSDQPSDRRAEANRISKPHSAKWLRKRKGARPANHAPMADIAAKAVETYAGNALGQAAYYLEAASSRGIPAKTGRSRNVSEKRLTEIGGALKKAIADSTKARAPIVDITKITQSQVIALVRYWHVKCQLKTGTINDRVSVLRVFHELIGRPGVIPERQEWQEILRRHGIALPARSAMAVLAKGWRDLGVEPDRIFEAMRAEGHDHVACQGGMMLEWGFRSEESASFRPAESIQDGYIIVRRGTKGGKERRVNFSSNPEKRARQLAVLEEAKKLVGRDGHIGIPGMDLDQMLEHQHYVFRKFGCTQAALGVTPHGLRHQFACDLFRELTGWPAPVLGELPAEFYAKNAEKVIEAMCLVSEALGHVRPQITGAYLSTGPTMSKVEHERVDALLAAMAAEGEAVEDLGIDSVWFTGRAAQGMQLLDGETLTVLVRPGDRALLQSDLDGIADALQTRLGRPVVLALWTRDGVPPDALEVLFHHETAEEDDAT